jgi:Flp pilus assembly protein TadD
MKYFLPLIVVLLVAGCDPVNSRKPTLVSIPANPQIEKDAKTAYFGGEFAKAVEEYEGLVKSDPHNIRYLVGLADAKRRAGDIAGADQVYDNILRINSKNPDALEGKGLILLSKGQFEDAIEKFISVLEIDALHWKSLNGLGIAHSLTQRHPLSIEYYMSALQISGDSPVVMNNIGLAYAFLKDYQHAEDYLNRAALRFAGDKEKLQRVELNLSLVYGIQEKMNEAEVLLRKYFDEPQVFHTLGIYAHLANDNDLAQTYLHKALSSSPGVYDDAWKTLKRVEPLVSKEE